MIIYDYEWRGAEVRRNFGVLGLSFQTVRRTRSIRYKSGVTHSAHHSFRIEKSCIEACNRDKYESSKKKSHRPSSLTKARSNDAKTPVPVRPVELPFFFSW